MWFFLKWPYADDQKLTIFFFFSVGLLFLLLFRDDSDQKTKSNVRKGSACGHYTSRMNHASKF